MIIYKRPVECYNHIRFAELNQWQKDIKLSETVTETSVLVHVSKWIDRNTFIAMNAISKYKYPLRLKPYLFR